MEKEKKYPYNIFFIGFMGAGKTSVAENLSRILGKERLEMDEVITKQQGMPVTDIFATYGEEYFRDLESQLLIDLQQNEPVIVSCGGGVAVRAQNATYMKKNGRVILLTASPQTVYERVRHSKSRPILNNNMNVEFIESLMEKRREKYLAAADLVVATDGKTIKEICDEIIRKLEEKDAGKEHPKS